MFALLRNIRHHSRFRAMLLPLQDNAVQQYYIDSISASGQQRACRIKACWLWSITTIQKEPYLVKRTQKITICESQKETSVTTSVKKKSKTRKNIKKSTCFLSKNMPREGWDLVFFRSILWIYFMSHWICRRTRRQPTISKWETKGEGRGA